MPGSRTIVSDTGPINYLVQIGQERLLSILFGTVWVPEAVRAELDHPRTPTIVRDWLASRPTWLLVDPAPDATDVLSATLHDGGRETVLLALQRSATLVLMDDRAGVRAPRARGLRVTGTLGILDLAAQWGFVDLAEAFTRLRSTSFRCRPELFVQLLADRERRNSSWQDGITS